MAGDKGLIITTKNNHKNNTTTKTTIRTTQPTCHTNKNKTIKIIEL